MTGRWRPILEPTPDQCRVAIASWYRSVRTATNHELVAMTAALSAPTAVDAVTRWFTTGNNLRLAERWPSPDPEDVTAMTHASEQAWKDDHQ